MLGVRPLVREEERVRGGKDRWEDQLSWRRFYGASWGVAVSTLELPYLRWSNASGA